ncbi:UNVERIFIED_CONTAM: Retrovirus-related Pol polyprotein from transposon gypsy [Sesamum indicum]
MKTERIEPIDDHKEVELVQGDSTRTTKIGLKMGEGLDTLMIAFLRNNVDMFAWNPSDFRGISPKVIVHRLNVEPTMRPIQQKKRTFEVEKNRVIEEEVSKLLKAGYVSEIQYTDWLSNVVVVCPKDPYQLPRIDLLVDLNAGYETFSMMGPYQGYHYIFMAVKDRDKTSFITDREPIEKTMEVYVDDMLVKSPKLEDRLIHLETAFAIRRTYGTKLNRSKCTFGIGGGKFLGYMVNDRGIEA